VETGECQLHARTQSRPEKSTLDQLLDAAHTRLIKQKSYFYLHPFAMSTNPSSSHWSASGTAKERWLATHPELLDSLAPEVGSLPFQTELAPERAPLGEEHQHWTQSLAPWITATEKSGDGCHAAEQALLLSQLAAALQRGETGVVLPDPSEATPLLGDADANRPLIVHPDSGLIQPRHLWQLEQQVAQQIRKRLAMQLTLPAPQKVESVLEQVLQNPELRMVNRNRGSGTRVLLDQLLQQQRPSGFFSEAKSHTAVAAAVAEDAGKGKFGHDVG